MSDYRLSCPISVTNVRFIFVSDIRICAYVVPRLSLHLVGWIEICDINKIETSKSFFYFFLASKRAREKGRRRKTTGKFGK